MKGRKNGLIDKLSVCFSFCIGFIPASCPWYLHFDSIASSLHLNNPPTPLVIFSCFWIYAETLWSRVCFLCLCVSGGPPGGLLCCHPPPPPACIHPDDHDWLGEEGVEVLLCCHMRESAYIQCLWIKTVKCRHKKFQECLSWGWGGGSEPNALSLCRGLLCSIFQGFVVAILILNHNCGWQGRVLMRGGAHLSVAPWQFNTDRKALKLRTFGTALYQCGGVCRHNTAKVCKKKGRDCVRDAHLCGCISGFVLVVHGCSPCMFAHVLPAHLLYLRLSVCL